jgi:hypothetical protein
MDRSKPGAKRVNLFVVGAQKAGTTALFKLLAAQQDICAPEKELHFFDRDERYQGGTAEALSAYHWRFQACEHQRYWADCTPIYMYLPQVPVRLARYNPNARIIVLLRSPADRALSQWNMEYRKGKERLPLSLALGCEYFRRRGQEHRVHSYLHRGFYSRQLARLLELFPRRQLLILQSEEMLLHPHHSALRVLRFLELPVRGKPTIAQTHMGEYASQHRHVRRILKMVYRREEKRLEKRFGLRWAD